MSVLLCSSEEANCPWISGVWTNITTSGMEQFYLFGISLCASNILVWLPEYITLDKSVLSFKDPFGERGGGGFG